MDSSDTVHQAEAFIKRLQGLLLRRSALGNKGAAGCTGGLSDCVTIHPVRMDDGERRRKCIRYWYVMMKKKLLMR